MTTNTFEWQGQKIPFRNGESVATALEASGIRSFGRDALGQETRYFCGIGACQNCLVRVDGGVVEACLTAAHTGLVVTAAGGAHG